MVERPREKEREKLTEGQPWVKWTVGVNREQLTTSAGSQRGPIFCALIRHLPLAGAVELFHASIISEKVPCVNKKSSEW